MTFEISMIVSSIVLHVSLLIFFLTIRSVKKKPDPNKRRMSNVEVHDPLRDKIVDMHERLADLQHRKFSVPHVEQRPEPISAKVIAEKRQELLKKIKRKNGNQGKEI